MEIVSLRYNEGPPNNTPAVEPHPDDTHDQGERIEVLFVRTHRVRDREVLEESEREEYDVEDPLEDVVRES